MKNRILIPLLGGVALSAGVVDIIEEDGK